MSVDIEKSRKALAAISSIICEAVEMMGDRGAPSGHIYAATMTHLTLDQYMAIESALVHVGALRKVGQVLHIGRARELGLLEAS